MEKQQAALSLYQLVGAPLHALIEAETFAANATLDFIERVGFAPQTREAESAGPAHEDIGKLRTISFQQERRTAEGEPETYKVEVPLLSILPIPALQVKEAELEYFVKIVELVPRKERYFLRKTNQDAEEQEAASKDESPRVPLPAHPPDMKALLGRGQPGAPLAPDSAFDMQVHIKIKVAQADPPAGLGRLFSLMEKGISSTRV